MDCGKTEVFLRELGRMCKGFYAEDCERCRLSREENGKQLWCDDFMYGYPKEAIEIVQKWSDEHPKKTRQSEFLKMFPNAKMSGDGVVSICPSNVDTTLDCVHNKGCTECTREYWLAEVE